MRVVVTHFARPRVSAWAAGSFELETGGLQVRKFSFSFLTWFQII